MRTLMWLAVILSFDYWQITGQAHECSVDNGRCTYKIELVDGCTATTGAKQQGGPLHTENNIQSDNTRINSIEEHLLKIKQDHSRMITDLENKITALSQPRVASKVDTRPQSTKQFRSSAKVGTLKIPNNKNREENQLLNDLHEEFSKLRKILYSTKRKLRETEKQLRLLRKQHSKTELVLNQTQRKLNKTETQLEERSGLLNVTKQKLNKCDSDRALCDKLLLESQKEHNKTQLALEQKSNKLRKTELELKEKNILLLETQKNLKKSEHHRKELEHLLLESENQRNNTEFVLNQTKVELNQTRHELKNKYGLLNQTQEKLNISENEGKRLLNESNVKSKQLTELKENLKLCKKEIKSKDIEIWEMSSDLDKLKKELQNCRSEVKEIKLLLEKALIKYHDLNLRHENLTEELNNTKFHLVQCSKEKISSYCGFEDDTLCGYTQENGTDHLDWIQWSMKTPSDWTGPATDHTCGNDRGHYMYVEATAMGMGNRARLVSPKYHGFAKQCVEFYYHMYGNHVGTLNVYLVIKGDYTNEFLPGYISHAFVITVDNWNDEELPPPVWRAYGNQGDVWTTATLEIPGDMAVSGYKVVFEVMTRAGYAGDVAIDDIRIFDGKCEGAVTLKQWRVRHRNMILDTLRNET